jgi:SAM-dependent methyltransferase
MDADYERLYHRLETSHWWFKSRRETLMHQLRDVDRSARVLDIGCSSGILLGELREAGFDAAKLHGIDISEAAIRNCHEAGLANCSKMDAQSITLEPGSFDLIIASDCLEHLEQEAEALRGWSSLLAPGGQMIIYVPAFQFLWGVHDTANQHFRRYTRGQLVEAVEGSDCRIVRSGYWNSLLFPAVLVVRTLARLLPRLASTCFPFVPACLIDAGATPIATRFLIRDSKE